MKSLERKALAIREAIIAKGFLYHILVRGVLIVGLGGAIVLSLIGSVLWDHNFFATIFRSVFFFPPIGLFVGVVSWVALRVK
ncbi:hypothetical protein N9R79_06415 [Vibrio sp.]|nr:hypothetical protein [Vibrio sp.]